MKEKMYWIKAAFAKKNNLPTTFIAKPLVETHKALYVYGRGEMDPYGTCCKCGRKLTHPGSIILGIGPICLGDWGMRDVVAENLTDADRARIQATVRSQKVDSWIPKAVIKDSEESNQTISVPEDHKMLKKEKKNGKGQPDKKQATLAKYKNGKDAIKIIFPFNYDTLNKVKTLPGRKFHGDRNPKCWTCPLSIEAAESLEGWGFELDAALEAVLQRSKISVNDVSADIEIPGLQMELYPFQKQGVSFIEAKDGKALIGDEMGLGKTCQALAYLQLHPEKRPAVIVVPASLKLNWEREAKMWMENPNTQILSGTKTNVPIVGEIIIINYDILPAWVGKLQEIKPQVLITDECHYYKNNKANRTKAVKALGKNIPHVIALSGTPIVNRPEEGLNAIQLIDPSIVGSRWRYLQRYCGAKHNGFGWDFKGATNTEELHKKLTSTIMLRRLKKDVLMDLPDKQYSFLPMEMDSKTKKEYGKAKSNFIAWIKENRGDEAAKKANNAKALAEIEILKQLAVRGKMKQAIDWIKDFIDVDGKLVVFATHKFVIDSLMTEFKDIAVKVDGSVTGQDRDKAVQAFQNDDKIRLFVGNIKAAGVGLTLTAASNVAFLELPWTPGELLQAEDRCHRIGQKNTVNVHYLLANNTIEQDLAYMLDKKKKILDSVLDGKETEQESLLSELIKKVMEG